MFKNPSITTRVRLAVAIPAAALALVILALFPVVQSFRIGGPVYNGVRSLHALQVEGTPSALVTSRAIALANQAYQVQFVATDAPADAAAQKVQVLDTYTAVRAAFHKSKQTWATSSTVTPGLRPLVNNVISTGTAVLNEIDTNLMPNLAPATATQARTAIARVNELAVAHDKAVKSLTVELGREVTSKERSAKSAATLRLFMLSAMSLAALIAAVIGSRGVMRSLLVPVEELTEQASRAAHEEIPALVAAVNAGNPGSENAKATPFPVTGNDEFSQLSVAMNAMQDTAINLAIDQARSRRDSAQSLINLGRRNQGLLARTLTFITELEQNERNPETLSHLFRLDHLTTRMRRNAESLLVLAGSEPPRVWTESVPLADVLRAALSEIESYGRVDLASMDAAKVKGTAVSDLTHLCAELMENATNFSPPSSRVVLLGRSVSDGYLLSIRDNGIGMTSDEIDEANGRLAERRTQDATPSKVLGHYVVSKLAARHGIQVSLSQTIGSSGITADIFLPDGIVERLSTAPTPAQMGGGIPTPAGAPPQNRDQQPQAYQDQPRQGYPAQPQPQPRQVYQSQPHPQPQQGSQAQPQPQPQQGYQGQQQPQRQPQPQPQPQQAASFPSAQPQFQPQHVQQYQPQDPSGFSRDSQQSVVAPPLKQVDRPSTVAPPTARPAGEIGEDGLRRRVRGAQVPARDVVPTEQQLALERRQTELQTEALREQAGSKGSVLNMPSNSQARVQEAQRLQVAAAPASAPAPTLAPSPQPAPVPTAPVPTAPVPTAPVAAPAAMLPPPPLPTRNRGTNWQDEVAPAGIAPDFRDPQEVRTALSGFQATPYAAPAGWAEPTAWQEQSAPAATPNASLPPQGAPVVLAPLPLAPSAPIAPASLPTRDPGRSWHEQAVQAEQSYMPPDPRDPEFVRASLSSFQRAAVAPAAVDYQQHPQHPKDQ